ncbi:MAG: hypothetical protein NTV64_00765 [Polaromonas sp.]|nr:hypothetical protein [Polaromonas sp.]
MKYKKSEAKEYARENFRGVWAATMTPFDDSLAMDEAAYRRNLRHWAQGQTGRIFLHVGGRAHAFF